MTDKTTKAEWKLSGLCIKCGSANQFLWIGYIGMYRNESIICAKCNYVLKINKVYYDNI